MSLKYVHHWLKHVRFVVDSIIRFSRQPSPLRIWVTDGKHVQHIDPCSAHCTHGVRVKQQNTLQRTGERKRLSLELYYLKSLRPSNHIQIKLICISPPSPIRPNPSWEKAWTSSLQTPFPFNVDTLLLLFFLLFCSHTFSRNKLPPPPPRPASLNKIRTSMVSFCVANHVRHNCKKEGLAFIVTSQI